MLSLLGNLFPCFSHCAKYNSDMSVRNKLLEGFVALFFVSGVTVFADNHPFEGISFIKAPGVLDRSKSCPASMFRRVFTITNLPSNAELSVCGLGYAYYYINGLPVTEDLFTAPVSNYDKTLWYNTYNVTSLLREGENVIAVACGNGWYNESLQTSWEHDSSPWRDKPKFILSLDADGRRIVNTDTSWICTEKTPILFNELRSGETFDARLYDPEWKNTEFNSEGWRSAAMDTRPPTGEFRLCPCSGIREECVLPAVSVRKTGENKYIFDFGRNISGYVRLSVTGESGDMIELRFAEKLTPEGEPEYHNMQIHYRNAPFALDRFICSGKSFTWSPRFTYHGFRYAEITGLREANVDTASAVFVHQDVDEISGFACSDPFLNRLFHAGQAATLSNLFYMPTDCPTREKLGWCNDAQSSCDQILTDFSTAMLFEKWLQDIYDAMLPNGFLPGIIPSSGWGYEWGNGPVSEGILFEVPYRLYLHTGEAKYLIKSLPYFKRSLAHFEAMRVNGEILYGLDDWTAPHYETMVKAPFVNDLLLVKFLDISCLAARLAGEKADEMTFKESLTKQKELCRKKYLNSEGACVLDRQTAVSMMICNGVYENLDPLKKQLRRLIEEKNYHFDCGMAGMPYLYRALNHCGLQEYAYKVLTAKGYPSYRDWDEDGMTTLYESWDMKQSLNHHMFSCFMTWMLNTIVGIEPLTPSSDKISVEPYYFEELDYAEGWRDTPRGKISVHWKRVDGHVVLKINVPEEICVIHKGKILPKGENIFSE